MAIAEHTIELDGSPVFYRSAPASGTPVVYLHGIPTSSTDLMPFLERTGGIAPDLIGFGRSGKAGHLNYSLDGLAGFVDELLDQLELEHVQLVGHGWGGAVGLVLAERAAERIERIVLINALPLLAGFHWSRVARLWRTPAIGELTMGSTTRWVLTRALRRGVVRADAWTPERIDEIWEQFDQGTQRAILRLHRSADEAHLAGAGIGLSELRAPALVVWGERDPWLPAEFGERYATQLPGASLELIPEAGHWPWLDQPDVVDRIVSFVT